MTEKLKVLDLFSGIGGFSLGLERTGGFETVAFCEIEEFPRKVLAKHWPEVLLYNDVRTITKSVLERDKATPNVITGGFPCQDISIAGKQAGINEETRSGLWSECLRLVSELRPQVAIFENVANLLSGPNNRPGAWFSRILTDLAGVGYDVEWRVLRGYQFGVPQTRTRVWFVTYPARQGSKKIFYQDAFNVASHQTWMDGGGSKNADTNNKGRGKSALPLLGDTYWTEIPNRERSGTNDRLSSGMDRYKSIGNSVIPQIPEMIGNAILASMQEAS